MDAVVDVIRQARATDRVLLAAGEHDVMQTIRKADPGTAIGSSLEDLVAFYRALAEGRDFEPAGHALQIPPTFMDDPLVTPEALAAAERHGVFIHVWTINEPDEMRSLLEAGAHGVMSDLPGELLRVARELGVVR